MATLLLLNSPNESKVSSDFTGKWSVRVSSLDSVAKANIPPNSVINKVTFECEMKRSGLNLSTSNTAIEVYWSDNNRMNAIGGYLLDQNSVIPTSYKKFTVDMTSSFHSGDELAGHVSVNGATYLVFCSDGVAIKDHYVRNVYITVDYTPPMYYLDLNGWIDGASSGGISPAGTADVYINGSLASNDCTDYYTQHYAGTTYEIKDIRAKTGYKFDGVRSGSLSGTLNSAVTVVLAFSKIRCTVSVSGNGGTVTGGGTYDYGSSVTLTATPNAGYQFVRWSDGNTSQTRTLTVTSDITLTAIFEAVQTKPEFTHASMTYGGHQVSQVNKVPAGQVCILAVRISNFN